MIPPSQYDSFWKTGETHIMKGAHFAPLCLTQVTRLKREKVQTSLIEASVMSNISTKATQWAFVQPKSADRLEQEMRSKIHIDITPRFLSILSAKLPHGKVKTRRDSLFCDKKVKKEFKSVISIREAQQTFITATMPSSTESNGPDMIRHRTYT